MSTSDFEVQNFFDPKTSLNLTKIIKYASKTRLTTINRPRYTTKVTIKTHTFLLDELNRLKIFMESSQDLQITFEDKIKDWPRSEVQSLLRQYSKILENSPS